MKLVLATANPDKAAEMAAILTEARVPVELVARPEGIQAVDETGATLADNARLKAGALCEATGEPSVADDTGLEVDVLDGEPGVHSARFAGERASYSDNVDLLLDRMRGVEPGLRTARFVTVAVACFPDGRELSATGSVEGRIAEVPRGSGGFGYDPVFIPSDGDGRTFAEMTPSEKDDLSHRGAAFRTLATALRAIVTASGES